MSERSAPALVVRRLADRVGALGGWRRRLVAFLAGAASVLALAPFHAFPVLIVTLAMLVWMIDTSAAVRGNALTPSGWRQHAAWRAGLDGWWFGFGYFVVGLSWIGEAFLVEAETFAWLLPFAVTLLPAALAVFWGLAAAAVAALRLQGAARVLALAIGLGLAEWLRGHLFTGFPWNTLGYVLTGPPVLMQSAALVGTYALTPIAVVVLGLPLVAAADDAETGGWRPWRAALSSCAVIAGLTGFGLWRLSGAVPGLVPEVRLRIVQPSIAQRDKWRPEHQRGNFRRHLDLSRSNADGRVDDLAGITHVIWPEAAMPFLPLERPEAISEIAALLPAGAQLVTGALRRGVAAASGRGAQAADVLTERRPAHNSLMVFGFGGGLAGLYDKTHLVPFGEYLPMQTLLESIGLQQLTKMRGGFTPGRTPRPLLTIAGLPPVGALICYEAIFPDQIIAGSERPGVLINITNDGWFGRTIGPYQHFHQARVRAVESGLPLVRAANNGISATIDPLGRVMHALALDQRGVIDSNLPLATDPPPAARHAGKLLLAICVLLGIGIALIRMRRNDRMDQGERRATR